MEYKIVTELVGGDINSIEISEHEFHKRDDIDLKDVWEDIPAPPIPKLKPFQKDLTYGRARGNTYGYQSEKYRTRRGLDKFFYTGSPETVPLSEVDDVTGKLGRLGIGLKTEVNAWEWTQERWIVKGANLSNVSTKQVTEYRPLDNKLFSERRLIHPDVAKKELIQVKHQCWVSDHFAITVGVKVI